VALLEQENHTLSDRALHYEQRIAMLETEELQLRQAHEQQEHHATARLHEANMVLENDVYHHQQALQALTQQYDKEVRGRQPILDESLRLRDAVARMKRERLDVAVELNQFKEGQEQYEQDLVQQRVWLQQEKSARAALQTEHDRLVQVQQAMGQELQGLQGVQVSTGSGGGGGGGGGGCGGSGGGNVVLC
jgi:hypothetical protein